MTIKELNSYDWRGIEWIYRAYKETIEMLGRVGV